jgi:predicted dehydrogenase
MDTEISRRKFIETGAASLGMALAGNASGQAASDAQKTVRVAVVGTGKRGTGLLGTMLTMTGLSFPALCDINAENLARAQELVVKAGHPKPEGYTGSDHAYEKLMARGDLDAVIIATYWQWHTPMAVSAMKNGKYAGVEVPAAITLEQCWDLVNTHERT